MRKARPAPATAPAAHATPYAGLSPDIVLGAIEAQHLAADGRLLALNSFENRVYQVGLEDRSFVVAKFYRPGRWSDAQIDEEHAFALEMADAELPMVAPIAIDGRTRFEHAGFRYAIYPRRGGRAPDLEQLDTAAWLGRLLGRLHAIGARDRFFAREALDVEHLLTLPAQAVLACALLPTHVRDRYARVIEAARDVLRDSYVPGSTLRLHGDCHPGNVLWTDSGPHFVDLDDARTGPAVQDLWMLMTGAEPQREALLEGYGQFRDFDFSELQLIEPLRLLRQIHHAGWIAARWADPAFPLAFPWASSPTWWETHVSDLTEAVVSLRDA